MRNRLPSAATPPLFINNSTRRSLATIETISPNTRTEGGPPNLVSFATASRRN